MGGKRFLTVFNDFDTVHLLKDVGAIPYYLSAVCGWDSSLAFFECRENLLDALRKTDIARRVTFISLGKRGSRILNAFETMGFILRHGRDYDVLNFYHDGLLPILFGLLFKRVNRNGLVYLKLDMSHLEFDRIRRIPDRFFSRCARRAKHFLSRRAVDIYTVEVMPIHEHLKDNDYFRGRLHYLPNGFTFDGFDDPRGWIEGKENIILTVGRLGDPAKYNELLVDALVTIDRHALSGWKVYFVGPVVSDSFRSYVDDAARKNPHLREIFVFTGQIDDKTELYGIYKRAKIFCLTSRWESFGFVLLEAMYFANYVISSDLPAPRDLTQDGTVGSLFPPGDAERLAELITEALSGKIDLAGRGMESHQIAKEQFDWRVIVKELDRILEEAARRPRG